MELPNYYLLIIKQSAKNFFISLLKVINEIKIYLKTIIR